MEDVTMTRTVRVENISDLAGEREIREFFSFCGPIHGVHLERDGLAGGTVQTAFVTFRDQSALEIALRLSGATLVDQVIRITPALNYIFIPFVDEQLSIVPMTISSTSGENLSPSIIEARESPGSVYASKAQNVVTSVLAKGSAIRQDAVNKAKAFDERHQLRANASAKVISFDKRVGLSEKITTGMSVVNEKVKSVDQRLQISDKTMAALFEAERKINNTGAAVKTNRYVTAGTAFFSGAFGKVARASNIAGARTRERFQLAMSNLTAKDPPIAA